MLVRIPRRLLAWLAASAVAYALASVAHTQTVLAGLAALDVRIGWGARLATTLGDLAGLRLYAVVLALALGPALLVARLVARRLAPEPRDAVAGAVAVAAALLAMELAFSYAPIASARGPIGFALQCLAGAAGGFAHARARRRLGIP